MDNAEVTDKGLLVRIGTVYDKYILQQPDLVPECKIYINGVFVGDIPIKNSVDEYQFTVEPSEDDLYEIEVVTNCYFIPFDIGENGDTRELAFQLYYIGPNK